MNEISKHQLSANILHVNKVYLFTFYLCLFAYLPMLYFMIFPTI